MKKRFTAMKAVLAAVCVAVTSITAGSSALPQTAVADEYEENGLKLWVYDCETGEESTRIFHTSGTVPMETELISASSFGNDDGGISTNAIIGSDDRTVVTNTTVAPYSYTCYMYSVYTDGNTSGIYSGFIIGPKAAVTVAHCAFNAGKTLDHIVVIPAVNVTTTPQSGPYGVAYSSSVIVPDAYINNPTWNDDWAVIELKSDIGNRTGWPSLESSSSSYNGTSVEVVGYPAKYDCSLQNKDTTFMISGKGKIRDSSIGILDRGRGTMKGDWDGTDGDSGAPVFAYYNGMGYTIIGIHTGSSLTNGKPYGNSTCFSAAARISKDMYDYFMSYR
ncbi:MAG: trypsin-like serine protease [Ruminococcaceae bacterium]|nr:trypsin-like serine protease [Oscillospiraceae bacterium]